MSLETFREAHGITTDNALEILNKYDLNARPPESDKDDVGDGDNAGEDASVYSNEYISSCKIFLKM